MRALIAPDKSKRSLTAATVADRSLARVASIDTTTARSLAGIEIIVASDVTNPLTGPCGAAVYGPQKGADRTTVRA